MTLKFQFMQIATHPMPQRPQSVKLLNVWKNVVLICLHGLKIAE